MSWLASMDIALFRLVNLTMSNPVFDRVMPWLSANPVFLPLAVLLGIGLVWKGSARARLCAVLVLGSMTVGDSLVCSALKHRIDRPRPYETLADVRVLGGRTDSHSMPSSHTANWFAATAVIAAFYRRSWRVLLPVALAVGFSRIYNGMHYPSDVLVGAGIGAASGWSVLWATEWLWQRAGPAWLPRLYRRYPSTRSMDAAPPTAAGPDLEADRPAQWIRLGYLLIGVLLIARLGYVAGSTIELSEDEAYQWLWAKHPALSYYSKPPLIAYTQWLGTALFGDRAFGVRFFSPVISALAAVLVLRFLARELNPRAGFLAVLIMTATPLLAVGGVLMTIDPLNVLFWTAAMISGWTAVRTGSTRAWAWVGLWTGLSFLSKYTGLFQLLSWAVFFVLWPKARAELRRPGPWLALGLVALSTVPVLIWNAQNSWITVTHLSERGGLHQPWQFRSRFITDFLLAEFALLNPVFCVASVWAAIACWRSRRDQPFALFLFSMSVPLLVFYAAWTLRARVQPNWIAPAIVPLFALMVLHWDERWRSGSKAVGHWFQGAVVLGLVAVVLAHDTNLVGKIAGRPLPAKRDPLARVRGWEALSQFVEDRRKQLELEYRRPAFIVTGHYGLAGLFSFYIPDARAGVPDRPLVFFRSSDHPENQFYFWRGYADRVGQNALFVVERTVPEPPPESIVAEFESVRDLGLHPALYRGRTLRQVQIFECLSLKRRTAPADLTARPPFPLPGLHGFR